MRPRTVRYLLLPFAVAAVVLAPRLCEIAGGAVVLAAAVRPATEVVRGRPDSPLGRWGAAWVTGLFGLFGSGLIVWGIFPAAGFAAGYVSLTLVGVAVLAPMVFGPGPDGRASRVMFLLVAAVLGVFAAAGLRLLPLFLL